MSEGFMGNIRPIMQLIYERMPKPRERQPLSLPEVHRLVKGSINPQDRDPFGVTINALNMMITEGQIMLDHKGDTVVFCRM